MIIKPAFRGVLCTTAHPDGCAAQVVAWAAATRRRPVTGCPARVLVVGASSGLGLGTRIAAAFAGNAATVGVCLERPGTPVRPGTAGWYRACAFEELAARSGMASRTIVGDAFSDEAKAATCAAVREVLGQVDLVIYSVAASRRRHPRTGVVHRSAMKTVGQPFTAKAYDIDRREVVEMTLDVASADEVADTVSVMGGEDWRWWVDALHSAGLLADRAVTVAFSYQGPPPLAPTYRAGTLGAAKDDLERTAHDLTATLRRAGGGAAHVAIMPALVTQASLAVPMNALYTLLLIRVMAEMGLSYDVIDPSWRMVRALSSFGCAVDAQDSLRLDAQGRLRFDEEELRDDVQTEIWRRWRQVGTGNVGRLGDVEAFESAIHAVYGFGVPGVDYTAPVDPVRDVPGIVHT